MLSTAQGFSWQSSGLYQMLQHLSRLSSSVCFWCICPGVNTTYSWVWFYSVTAKLYSQAFLLALFIRITYICCFEPVILATQSDLEGLCTTVLGRDCGEVAGSLSIWQHSPETHLAMAFFFLWEGSSLKLLEITQVLCLEPVLVFVSFQEAMLSVIV